MKPTSLFFHKGNDVIKRLHHFFVVFLVVNSWIVNVGYCRTQSIELLPSFFWEVPFYYSGLVDKAGYNIGISTFAPLKTAPSLAQKYAANLVFPACHESHEVALSLANPINFFAGNRKPMGDENSQNRPKSKSADGFNGSKERLAFLWRHFLIGFLLGLIAVAINSMMAKHKAG
jgi:hypothetical protein